MIHVLVQQKLTQCCKAIVDNFKKRKKEKRGTVPKSLRLQMKMAKLQPHHRNTKDRKRLLHATICQQNG